LASEQTGGQGSMKPNVAETFLSPVIFSEHFGLDPLHAPPQNRNWSPSGTAVSVMVWLGRNVAVHLPGQLIPPGPVTEPPVGSSTVRVGGTANEADTVLLPVIRTVQVFWVPPQAPPHRSKAKPGSGTAVRVGVSVGLKVAVQSGGQLIPGPVTRPLDGGVTFSTGGLDTVTDFEPTAVCLPGRVTVTLT
jgi:hypothetical protein